MLQFTLLELWHRRSHNRVSLDVYKSLGGARNALTKVADQVFDNLLEEEREIARKIPHDGIELGQRDAETVGHDRCVAPPQSPCKTMAAMQNGGVEQSG